MEFSKGIIGSIVGVISYLYNCANEVLAVLIFFILLDYIIGVICALKDNKFDKTIGIWGAVKKILYGAIIITAYLIDFVITYTGKNINPEFNTSGGFGIAATLYLIGTEGLSMLKGLICLGLPVPPFLEKALGFINKESQSDKKQP